MNNFWDDETAQHHDDPMVKHRIAEHIARAQQLMLKYRYSALAVIAEEMFYESMLDYFNRHKNNGLKIDGL